MRAEQLAQKFWDALDRESKTLQVTDGDVALSAVVRTHDAFSCAMEQITFRWSPSYDWLALAERCAKTLLTLHREFALVERDDVHRWALFRSPVARGVYWEARLWWDETATLTVQRFQPQEQGKRTAAPFLLTIEQLTELVAGLTD